MDFIRKEDNTFNIIIEVNIESGVVLINVLSLFDGMSCGQIALERAGIKESNYFASEVDKFAMQVAKENYPNTQQLGDVLKWKQWDLPKIDLLMGGSPCQDLSRIKSKDGKGLQGEKSKLFFTFLEALEYYNSTYFLLENVVMSKDDEDLISSLLGVQPTKIDSGDFSAQSRERLYWTNIPFLKDWNKCDLVLKDILQPETEILDKYYYNENLEIVNGIGKRVYGTMNKFYTNNGKRRMTDTTSRVYNPLFKCATLTAVSGGHQEKKVFVDDRIRKLTPLEYERLQTVPDSYTASVSDSQRYKMLGNGWTVDAIAHILKSIK